MANYVWGNSDTQYFYELGPEDVMDGIDALGLKSTGRCLQLNSMENRVYEIEVNEKIQDTGGPADHFVVAKFYRPGRWTREQILDEHQFLLDLQEAEISVIAPMQFSGQTLFHLQNHGIFYALFPKKGGRTPDEFQLDDLELLGRTLARIHSIGASKKAEHRIEINPDSFGRSNINFLKSQNALPNIMEENYFQTVELLLKEMEPMFENTEVQRIHGDCHKGNTIWRDNKVHFVDFDDMLMGPPVQDIWLLVPGTDQESRQDRAILLEAYESMRSFDHNSFKLIEPLRTLRLIHFSAWICKRWKDPSFKHHFPYFGTEAYWSTQIADLREQYRLIMEVKNPNPYWY